MIDESSEHGAGQADLRAAHRVNWFRTERPVAGTTYRREAVSQLRPATTAEDTTPR